MMAGGLISVVDRKYLNGPARVLVEIPDFRKDLTVGEPAESDGIKIIFDSGFEINLASARLWQPVVRNISVRETASCLILEKLKGYVFVRPQYIENFKNAALKSDPELLAASVGSLTGLGAGLTPSGDDFLAGFISACHFFKSCERHKFILENVKINFDSTNLISACYLKYAVEGRISELISNVVISASGENDNAGLWIEKLLGIGATSGADTLNGILAAMEVYNDCKYN